MDATESLRAALDAVDGVLDATLDANVDELALRLALCDRIVAALNHIAPQLEIALVESMDEDRHTVLGVGYLVREPLTPSVRRDHDAAKRDVRRAVEKQVAVDPLTGELRPGLRLVADAAWDLIDGALGIGGKAFKRRGFDRLGLDPDDYQEITERGYTVRLHPEGEG